MTWEQTFTALVATRGAALNRYAYLLCGDVDEAADLVQEALLHTFGRVTRNAGPDNAEAYVRRAILHDYLDRQRRRARWRLVRHLFASQLATMDVDVAARCDTRAALALLSPRQRACVVLRYYQDCAVAEIAAQLGCSHGAVKRHLSDAAARLATALDAPRDGLADGPLDNPRKDVAR